MLDKFKNLFHTTPNITPNTSEIKNPTKSKESDKVTLGGVKYPDNGFNDYSNLAKSLAKTYSDAAQEAFYSTNQSATLKKGLDIILSSPETTTEEKLLAKLGIDSVKDSVNDRGDGYLIRSKFMDAINSSISGPTGIVLSKIFGDAGRDAFFNSNKSNVLTKGFKAILANPKATEKEKFLAKLGIDAGEGVTVEKGDVYNVRAKFMDAINEPMNGSAGSVMSTLFGASAKDAFYFSSQNTILENGFNAILASPETTAGEKNIAKLGLEAGKGVTIEKGDAYEVRAKFMEAINNSTDISAVNLAKLFSEAGKDAFYFSSQNTILENGFNAILASPEATDKEKTFAQLGLNSGKDVTIEKGDAYLIRAKFMEAMSNSSCVFTVDDLSKLFSDAAKEAFYSSSQSEIIKNGLRVVLANPEATEKEKAFAKLGLRAGNGVNSDKGDAYKVRAKFMEAMSDAKGIPDGAVMAELFSDAAKEAFYSTSQNTILENGFNAILDSKLATDNQKSLAKLGIEAGKDMTDDSDAYKVRTKFMEAILQSK